MENSEEQNTPRTGLEHRSEFLIEAINKTSTTDGKNFAVRRSEPTS